MNQPLLSIIIPTHNRPHLLEKAVKSALQQTLKNIEVIVVDDASDPPAQLADHPQLSVIRLSTSHGGAGARNVGTQAAQGRWITYLDDDDQLLPHMAETSLKALAATDLPPPVAVISGIEVVDETGQHQEERLPPPVRFKGCYFSLEDLEPGCSYNTKQTLVVERDVIEKIGGWDENFRSRVHSELFLRLNLACSIVGIPEVTYCLLRAQHEPRISKNRLLRQESFQRLIQKHRSMFWAKRSMYASFVYEHAKISYYLGQKGAALFSLIHAFYINPKTTLSRLLLLFKDFVQSS
ncbi:glycosyltransferase family 2 protein [Almyronema epifaneia]|uniref:Glycosyltransferase family 2 protein n=1 Tax=Almyronema epifaneia S1 TaxID=2991925 RepID=A0ABW6IA42_9CYAN